MKPDGPSARSDGSHDHSGLARRRGRQAAARGRGVHTGQDVEADADDTSPPLTLPDGLGGDFTAASAAALAATGRFMFPNVLNEPPQQFKAGFPTEYGPGVDERWKEKFGVWIVRTPDDVVARASGFYALLVTCTHLGCTPNYLSAEAKFKCPCHGSGFRTTGINFEGPAPRPLERARIVLADDGQPRRQSAEVRYLLGQWPILKRFSVWITKLSALSSWLSAALSSKRETGSQLRAS